MSPTLARQRIDELAGILASLDRQRANIDERLIAPVDAEDEAELMVLAATALDVHTQAARLYRRWLTAEQVPQLNTQ